MSAHTPGDWRVLKELRVSLQHAPAIAFCAPHECTSGEEIPNARLIAAAPDLLAALQNLSKVYGTLSSSMKIGSERRLLWEAAFAAVDRATGAA